jgi:ADP-heptose:LPS heptosyltransferase/GT2 family glycosyltransferase
LEVEVPPPEIKIEMDQAVPGGFVSGRFDLHIRGCVVSSATIEEVELLTKGDTVARLQFGRAEPALFAAGVSDRQYGFQFSLPRLREHATESCPCVIRARTSEGQTHDEAFEIVVDPTHPESPTVAFGATQRGLSLPTTRPSIMFYVERAELDSEDNLLVHGWAIALSQVVAVQAYIGEEMRPSVAQIGGRRDDVAKAYSAYPNARTSGFSLSAHLGPAMAKRLTTVRLQAISLNGHSQEVTMPLERTTSRDMRRRPQPAVRVAASPLKTMQTQPFDPLAKESVNQVRTDAFDTDPGPPDALQSARTRPKPSLSASQSERSRDPRRKIHSFLDDVGAAVDGTLGVAGWAVCTVGITGISIHLDGKKIGDAELALPRPDVEEQYSTIPMARLSGFRFEHRIPDLCPGQHDVLIVIQNGMGDVEEDGQSFYVGKPAEPTSDSAAAPRSDLMSELYEFRFELDNPTVVAGAVVKPVTGRLTIEGWAMARSGVSAIEVLLDDQPLGKARYGLVRQDVGAAFPNWTDSLRSGYAFYCPRRSLRNGQHVVSLVVRAKNGQELVHRLRLEVKQSEGDDELASIRRRVSRVETGVVNDILRELDHYPEFYLVLRQIGKVALNQLRATIESLRTQIYPAWHLSILADDTDAANAVRMLLAEFDEDLPGRIVVVDPTDAEFDAPLATTNHALPTLYGALCPGDELGCDALAEIALAGGLHREADFFYADEARRSPVSHEYEPFFKPNFSPDLLLSTNYIGRPWFACAGLLQRCDLALRALLADGEYDLVLRLTEQSTVVHHVPKLLARRGAELLDDDTASRAALVRAAERRGFGAELMPGCVSGTYRLKRTQTATGKVSIIIPTCAARGYIETCVRTLRERTIYKNYEIVCLDNVPDSQTAWKVWLHQNADKVVDMPGTFNWARFNNEAVNATDGEYLLFLNDDIEILQEDWLDTLLEHAQRPEVGVVGPLLLYPDRCVQHAGIFLGAGIGRHAFRILPEEEPGYFGLALTQRNVIAVTGACMLVRRSFFEALGGFEEAHSVINNDLDFCLRVHQSGKLTVFTPHAKLIHHELASRDRIRNEFDTTLFESRWKTLFAAGDPYFSPRLSRNSDDYRPDDEPVQAVFPSYPLFRADEIRRILVVKLDHIGDFVTALPAIRRLKLSFPQASITVLASRAARAFAALEPSIDEWIEFEFFHARSQLGDKELTKQDLMELAERLAPYRFDIAVDMRKHLSTRDVLRYTGARFLAGYDYMGQFPFLDIALEWDGDKTLQRKRSHVVDDLLALAEVIGIACATDRSMLTVAPDRLDPATLSEPVRALFGKPVVAIHPGAGNITKQWPPDHFVALIDLLTERDAVNVLLIGGPDEQELAETILADVQRGDRVASVAGQTSLVELPRILAACTLYIGNDSGPKHIAAALGVHTIGIHSGVVDAIEWGPVGRRAVALRRNMSCSPCYLARAEDCPRDLACLRQLEPSIVHQTAELLLARAVTPIPARPVHEATLVPPDTGQMIAMSEPTRPEPAAFGPTPLTGSQLPFSAAKTRKAATLPSEPVVAPPLKGASPSDAKARRQAKPKPRRSRPPVHSG